MRSATPVIVLAAASCARGGTINFESLALTSSFASSSGAFTVMGPLLDGDGVAATIRRTSPNPPSFGRFDTINLAPYAPAGWGERTLSPAFGQGPTAAATDKFVADLFAPGLRVTGVSIQFGDFGDDSGNARLQAWSGPNGTGMLLFDASSAWSGNFQFGSAAGTIGVTGSATSIGSITFWGEDGALYPNSLYWDNLSIVSEAVIPLPHAAGMGLAGLGAIAVRRRSR